MKKALILLTSAMFMMALAAAPGCSGGDDDDDDDDDDGGSLASGTYAVSGAAISDTCTGGTDSYYAGVTEVDVTVSGQAIEIDGFPDVLGYDIEGTDLVDNTFGTPATDAYDMTDNTATNYPLTSGNEYSCIFEISTEYAGTITGQNEFSLEDTISIAASATSGAGCTLAIVNSAFTNPLDAFPCAINDGVDLAL